MVPELSDEQAKQVLNGLMGDAYARTDQEADRPAFIAAAQKRHRQFPTLSREPLDLFMLHHELAGLMDGDHQKAFQAADLFARYLDTVLLDLADQGQHRDEWDYDRMKGLLLTLADQLEGRDS